MKQRDQDRLTRSICILLIGACLLGSAGISFWPVELDADSGFVAARTATAKVRDVDSPDSTAATARDWNRSLQGRSDSAVDSNRVPAAIAAPTLSGLNIYLTATMIEPQHSYAMFMDREGTVDIKAVGGELSIQPAGVRVESIAAEHVVVSYAGKLQTLRMLDAAELDSERDDQVGLSSDGSSRTNGESHETGRQPQGSEDGDGDGLDSDLLPSALNSENEWLNGAEPEPAGLSDGGGA